MPFQNNVHFKTPQSSQILNCGEIVCAKAASTAKSNWNDEDGIGHERKRSAFAVLLHNRHSVVAVW